MRTEVEEIRRPRRSWWRWWPAIPLAAVAIFLVIGIGLTLIRARREAKIQWAAMELTAIGRALMTFRKEVGTFPPDDLALRGGWPTFDGDETLAYHLARRFTTKTGRSVNMYISVTEERLSDVDGDGFKEYRDPWDGVYVYALRKPAPGENPPRFFDIASPGHDGDLGGQMVPGKGYVPATTPEGKAAEADNVTNW